MKMQSRSFRTKDVKQVRPAAYFVDVREPELRIGDIASLNSGGPRGLIVAISESRRMVTFAYCNPRPQEVELPAACLHRVSCL